MSPVIARLAVLSLNHTKCTCHRHVCNTGPHSFLRLFCCLQQGHFLLEDPNLLKHELALKEEAFATKKDVVLAAEERSLPAQQVG